MNSYRRTRRLVEIMPVFVFLVIYMAGATLGKRAYLLLGGYTFFTGRILPIAAETTGHQAMNRNLLSILVSLFFPAVIIWMLVEVQRYVKARPSRSRKMMWFRIGLLLLVTESAVGLATSGNRIEYAWVVANALLIAGGASLAAWRWLDWGIGRRMAAVSLFLAATMLGAWTSYYADSISFGHSLMDSYPLRHKNIMPDNVRM